MIVIAPMELEPIHATCYIRRLDPTVIPHLMQEATKGGNPGDIFMRLFYIFASYRQDESALSMQSKALAIKKFYRLVAPNEVKIKLLALVAGGEMMDNTPLDFLIENSDIQLDFMYIDEYFEMPAKVPEHDILFIAMGESVKNTPILNKLTQIISYWPKPLLNNPESILKCARDTLFKLLKGANGIYIPSTEKLNKLHIQFQGSPIAIRPQGTHAGVGFKKISSVSQLDHYLSQYDQEQSFYVSEYVAYESPDGLFRKYRIVLIGGEPYICHLAISENWIVHYIASGMELSELKRNEERYEMFHFKDRFAKKHRNAFKQIHERIGLDYVVIDCAELQTGELLIFEADPGSWVHATDPVELFPYKSEVMQKAFEAFRNLLLGKAEL